MTIWTVILITALLTGLMGWCMYPFIYGMLWICDWSEGIPINWGWEAGLAVAGPFIWVFSLLEIIIVFGIQ